MDARGCCGRGVRRLSLRLPNAEAQAVHRVSRWLSRKRRPLRRPLLGPKRRPCATHAQASSQSQNPAFAQSARACRDQSDGGPHRAPGVPRAATRRCRPALPSAAFQLVSYDRVRIGARNRKRVCAGKIPAGSRLPRCASRGALLSCAPTRSVRSAPAPGPGSDYTAHGGEFFRRPDLSDPSGSRVGESHEPHSHTLIGPRANPDAHVRMPRADELDETLGGLPITSRAPNEHQAGTLQQRRLVTPTKR